MDIESSGGAFFLHGRARGGYGNDWDRKGMEKVFMVGVEVMISMSGREGILV